MDKKSSWGSKRPSSFALHALYNLLRPLIKTDSASKTHVVSAASSFSLCVSPCAAATSRGKHAPQNVATGSASPSPSGNLKRQPPVSAEERSSAAASASFPAQLPFPPPLSSPTWFTEYFPSSTLPFPLSTLLLVDVPERFDAESGEGTHKQLMCWHEEGTAAVLPRGRVCRVCKKLGMEVGEGVVEFSSHVCAACAMCYVWEDLENMARWFGPPPSELLVDEMVYKWPQQGPQSPVCFQHQDSSSTVELKQ